MNKITTKIKEYNINMNEMIGRGAFGKVYFAYKLDDEKKYAVKIISLHDLEGNKLLDREKNPLIFEHTNIVKYYDSYKNDKDLYIMMEYCEGGDLLEIMKKNKKNIMIEKKALKLIYPISLALNYLYKTYKIIHRDVKPENILLQNGIPKLTDFGFSTVENLSQTSRIGTKRYMAPEVFLNESYDYKCDVWSFGIMLYELLYSHSPWGGKEIEQIFKNCIKEPLEFGESKNVSESTKNLLKKMLCISKDNRSGWDEIIFIMKWNLCIINNTNEILLFVKEINSIIKLLTENWKDLNLKLELYYSNLFLLYKVEIFLLYNLNEYQHNKLNDNFHKIFEQEKESLNFLMKFLKENEYLLYKDENVKLEIYDDNDMEFFRKLKLLVEITLKKTYDNFKKINFKTLNEANLFFFLKLVYFSNFLRNFDEEEQFQKITYVSKAKNKMREELLVELIELYDY